MLPQQRSWRHHHQQEQQWQQLQITTQLVLHPVKAPAASSCTPRMPSWPMRAPETCAKTFASTSHCTGPLKAARGPRYVIPFFASSANNSGFASGCCAPSRRSLFGLSNPKTSITQCRGVVKIKSCGGAIFAGQGRSRRSRARRFQPPG